MLQQQQQQQQQQQHHHMAMSLFSYAITVVFPPWAVCTNIRINT
jgi:hypothetical protein